MLESPRSSSDPGAAALELSLRVTDPESVAALAGLEAGAEREAHALRALRIGLLALRQAAGVIDADAVRREGEQILNKLKFTLNGQQALFQKDLENALRAYFDPQSGSFERRVRSLVAKDGDLERVLREQVRGADSPLQQTLQEHFGPASPLMRLLSPSDSAGLLHGLQRSVDDALKTQRDRILGEFSLDNQEGALARLVRDLKANHADISQALQERVGEVVGEFSLDDEGSALSRLVRRVDEAQRKISAEFSLDEEASALARLRRELMAVLERGAGEDAAFREAVLRELGELHGARREADRSTRHGLEFEDELFAQLQRRAQEAGDVATATGTQVGLIPNSKVGDAVWELGPEHAAGGARIVVEAKESRGVSLADARAEIEVARKNRGADVGLFVFSQKTAPEGLRPFQRLGPDVFLVWDAADPGSDVWLEAALETARALCSRAGGARAARAADFEAIDRAILALEKLGEQLEEITTASNSIESANSRIRERVRKSREQIRRQVDRLQDAVGELKDGA